MSAETDAVLGHHVQALMSCDLDEIMKDYCQDSVLFTANGVASGTEGIRAMFEELLKMFTPEKIANLKEVKQEANGDYVYVIWEMPPAVKTGCDTFHVRDGKIMMQSVIIQPA